MPDGYETAQRGGFRGGYRGGYGGGYRGRYPRRYPVRRFPRFFFYPIYYNAPPRCYYIDRYGRCCNRYGNCYYDYYSGAYPEPGGSDDSIAAWSPSETWERIEDPE